MKKAYIKIFFITIVVLLGLSNISYANKNELISEDINTFIKSNFENVKIVSATKVIDGIEVNLSDDTKIFFDNSNEWRYIASSLSSITKFLPKVVLNSFKKNYPKESILKINKNWCGFSIYTDKKNEIYFDKNGLVLGIINSDKKK